MSTFRCKPHCLAMSESSPFGQKYAYGSEHSLDVSVTEEYFISQAGRFRAGDEIRVTQHETQDQKSKIIAFAEILVVSGGKELEFFLLRKPTRVRVAESAKKAA